MRSVSHKRRGEGIYSDNENYLLYEGDCLEWLKDIADNSIDMVLCDLPYGTTRNRWDSILPLDVLWAEYNRVCKKGAAVVLSGYLHRHRDHSIFYAGILPQQRKLRSIKYWG